LSVVYIACSLSVEAFHPNITSPLQCAPKVDFGVHTGNQSLKRWITSSTSTCIL